MAQERNNPFVGLRPYRQDESHLFFGREELTEEVLGKLSVNRFAAIMGASGAGKSSFVYCSLLPGLEKGFEVNNKNNWKSITFIPRFIEPLENLIDHILKNSTCPDATKNIITKNKSEIHNHLDEIAGENTNLLLFIDQFEELFRTAETNKINEFLDFIIETTGNKEHPIFVLMTMRSDLIGYCADYPNFTKKLNSGQYLIPKMTREQKRRAIVEPIKLFDAEISEFLVERILDEEEKHPNQLPVLQHVLMLTWQHWERSGKFGTLMENDYEAVGTMDKALSIHANEVYEELDDEKKYLAERLFRTIAINEEGTEIRNPKRLDEIIPILDYPDEKELLNVIDAFRQDGRSFLLPPHFQEIEKHTIIDISHESLIRVWDMLSIWAEKEQEAVKQYISLAERAELYKEGKISNLSGQELQIALNWRNEEKPSKEWAIRHHPGFENMMLFIDNSKREELKRNRHKTLMHKRKRFIQRIIFILFFIIGFAGIVLALYASRKSLVAQAAKAEAEQSAQIAEKERLEAENQKMIAEKKKTEALLAREEALKQEKIAINQAIRADNALRQALLNERIAKANKDTAVEAVKNEKLALIQAQNSEKKAREAQEALFLLAEAKAIAQHSISQHFDGNYPVSTNLGLHAYYINTQNKGAQQITSIYKALSLNLNYYQNPEPPKQVHPLGAKKLEAVYRKNLLVSAGMEGDIRIWSIDNTQRFDKSTAEIKTISKIDDLWKQSITDLKLSSSGKDLYVAVGSKIKQFNVGSSSKTKIKNEFLTDNQNAIKSLEMVEDGSSVYLFITSTKEFKVIHIEDEKANEIHNETIKGKKYLAVHNGASDIRIAMGGDSGSIGVYKMAKDDKKVSKMGNVSFNRKVSAIEFNHSGTLLAVGATDGLISIILTSNYKVYSSFLGHIGLVSSLCFNPKQQNQLASGSLDKTARLWLIDKEQTEEAIVLENPSWIHAVSFTPDGKYLLGADAEGRIKSWPTKMEMLANQLCNYVTKKLTKEEMVKYTGADINYKKKNCVSF